MAPSRGREENVQWRRARKKKKKKKKGVGVGGGSVLCMNNGNFGPGDRDVF